MSEQNLFVMGSLVALFLGGCAGQAVKTSEQIVMERAQARWDAARAGDFEKSFSFTSPTYRAVTDIKSFKASTSGSTNLVSAKVLSVTCASDSSCAAKIRIEFYEPITPRGGVPGIIDTHYDEPWVMEDGEWWFVKR